MLYSLAILKSVGSLDQLSEFRKTALFKCWDNQTRSLLMDCLAEARALGGAQKTTDEDLNRIEKKAAQYLGEDLVKAARRPMSEMVFNTYDHGKKMISLDFSLKAPDLAAIDLLCNDNLFWICQSYDRIVSDRLRRSLWAYYETGAKRLELAEHLEETLGQIVEPKIQGYFQLLADHWVARTNELGRVAGYEDAGIEYVQVVAVLDSRTTQICRSMHGRVIPVRALGRQRDRILEASRRHDIGAMKRAQPLFNDDSKVPALARTSALIDAGVALPPYHFRCRTTTVAYFQPLDYPEKVSQWATDGEVPKNELPGLLDYARKAHWGSHKVTWGKEFGGDGTKRPAAFVHYMKHGTREFRTVITMAEYNERIASLIRRGDRDAYLIIEDKKSPHPQMLFHDKKTGEQAIISLEGQTIATFSKRRKGTFKLPRRIQVCLPLPDMKGVSKSWIQGWKS